MSDMNCTLLSGYFHIFINILELCYYAIIIIIYCTGHSWIPCPPVLRQLTLISLIILFLFSNNSAYNSNQSDVGLPGLIIYIKYFSYSLKVIFYCILFSLNVISAYQFSGYIKYKLKFQFGLFPLAFYTLELSVFSVLLFSLYIF